MKPMLDRVLAGEVVSVEQMLAQPSGEERWEAIHYAPNRDAAGEVIGIYAVHTDIHDQKRNEDALRRANWMLSSHIDNTPLAVLEWDRDFRLVRWSPQAERLFGWRADEVLGMPIDGNPAAPRGGPRRGRRAPRAAYERRRAARDGPHAQSCAMDGETIWCEWYHSCLHDDHGNIVSILSFVQDVSLRIRGRGAAAAHGDPRRADRPSQPCAAAGAARAGDRAGEAQRHRRVGVLFIDLDRFKNVNDTLGHRIGDELLKEVSRALSRALRECRSARAARRRRVHGGRRRLRRAAMLGRIAQKLLDAVAHPFRIEEHDIYVTSSIGISVYPDDSDDPEELLKHADVAMYRSKELGRNTYPVPRRRSRAAPTSPARARDGLRAALNANLLKLHYQPIVELRRSLRVGAEALLRWDDPVHGSVSPKVFVALAEESGLIHSLGEWVLRSAAEQCVKWRREGLALNISVNLSGRQFYRDDIAQRISEIVRAAGCEPSWIELEVTETSLLHDLDSIRKALHLLRNEGFTVAIDDFGTGYSSLTHLKHFPIDTLKIDISFIADLETDPGDAAITEAIIGLARGLGLRVVAEGVGTKAQLEFLAARGCHCFQGYWISRPLAAADFENFLRSRLSPAARSESALAYSVASQRRSSFAGTSHCGSSISMCARPGTTVASTP